MKATLRDRLIRVEQQFLLAIAANDEQSLQIFAQEWTQLAHDIQSGEGGLDENTVLLLSRVSRFVASMTCCILKCGVILQEAQSSSLGHFILDLPTLPAGDQYGISQPPSEIAPYHLLFSSPSSTAPCILGHQSLLDSYAYRWLMQNIHDPYPTSAQMQIIGDVARASVAQVEIWFQEFRDSIGWTKLSRDFFGGSTNATVAAARRVYLEGAVNASFEVIFAFASVKASAETFFSENPPLQAEHADEAGPQVFQSVGAGPGDPSKSSSVFSDLSVDEESEMEDTTPPPFVAGRKRRFMENINVLQVSDLQRQEKRLRLSPNSDLTLRNTEDLPSSSPIKTTLSEPMTTQSSDETPTSPVLVATCPTNSEPSFSLLASTSRKRKREDSEENPSERAACSPDFSHATRRRRLSDKVSPLSPDRSRCSCVIPDSNSLLEDASPTDGGFDPSMLQVPIDVCPPFDLVNVHEWDKMPIPQGETVSQGSSIYVSGSDLPSLDPTLPERFEATQSTQSRWANDPGSLEDLSFLLQFPQSTCSGFMFSPAPLYWEIPLSLQDNDSRNVGAFSDQFQPDSSQSSSSLSPSSNTPSPAPSTPDNSTLLATVSPFCGTDTDESALIWDSSTPPSDVLPGLFHDNVLTPDWGSLVSLQAPLC